MTSSEKDTPLVSILTNTYNRANLIHRCIESIQKQTYQNYEHIIVDGNSTDNTEEVVKAYNDPHIIYIKLDDKGPEKQMRAGSTIAKGKYITFLDDDDEYVPEKLEKQVALFETEPPQVGLVYCWMAYYNFDNPDKVIDVHKTELRGNVYDISLTRNLICGTPTLMVRREIFEAIGGSFNDSHGMVGSDVDLGRRICRICEVDYVPEFLVRVYVNHGHARLSTDFYKEKAKRKIESELYTLTEFADVFERHPDYRVEHFYQISWAYKSLKNNKEAWRYYRQYSQCHPKFKERIRLLIKLIFNR